MAEKAGDHVSYVEAGVLENALVMIVVLDNKGTIIGWNHAAETITGYTHDEVIGKTTVWKSLYPDKEYRRTVTKKIAEILATRNYFENLETTIRTRSGDSRAILWNTKEITTDGSTRAIAVGLDITDQKEMAAFQQSIVDNANVLIAVLDRKGNVLVWNDAAESITGYSRAEVIGNRSVWKHLYPDADYRQTITRKINDIITRHQYFENLEATIVTNKGDKRIISWNTKQIEAGGEHRSIAVGLDITDQKEMAAFQQSIVDNANVLIAVLDRKGNVLVWNDAAESITGYSRAEVIGNRSVWQHLYPDPDYRRTITKRITDIITANRYFENLDTTIRTRAGDTRIIRWNTREIVTGADIREIAIGRDITRQKELDAFRESVIDNANVLITVLAPNGKVLVWNKAAESITGYSRAEVIGSRDVWQRLYPDADYRRTITKRITDIITTKRYFENLETSIVTNKGEKRIISWNTKQIEAGGEHRNIAIGRDITEQRKAEEALLAYISEMAMRLKQPIGIIGDNLRDLASLIRDGKLTKDEMVMMLEGQVRNAAQIAANVQEFQKAIVEKNKEIPEAYRKFLEG